MKELWKENENKKMIGGGNAASEEKIKGMPITIAQCPMLR